MRQLISVRQSAPSSGAASSSTTSSTTASPPRAPSSVDCGLRDALSTRIVGGVPAEEGDWPWMAALFTSKTRHLCGATLISDRHILTAAHCLIE